MVPPREHVWTEGDEKGQGWQLGGGGHQHLKWARQPGGGEVQK